jgi:hypothetical protein
VLESGEEISESKLVQGLRLSRSPRKKTVALVLFPELAHPVRDNWATRYLGRLGFAAVCDASRL